MPEPLLTPPKALPPPDLEVLPEPPPVLLGRAEGEGDAGRVEGLGVAVGRAPTLPVVGRVPTLPVEGCVPTAPVEGRVPLLPVEVDGREPMLGCVEGRAP